MFIQQEYHKYSAEDHEVWSLLYRRRMPELRRTACKAFLNGADIIGLDEFHIPDLNFINTNLFPITRWQATAVSGYMPARDFFECLSQRRFPTTVGIRRREQLDYLPEPDIFHDVFGHVPMHADKAFGDFLEYYGKLAFAETDEAKLTELSRLFWFTVEFGLIREAGEVKLFGSGLMSSPGEGAHCLTDAVQKLDFDLDKVVGQSFEIDHYQPILFVIESFEQLTDALAQWEKRN
jgi:phenylalanine-4-hydroxylase